MNVSKSPHLSPAQFAGARKTELVANYLITGPLKPNKLDWIAPERTVLSDNKIEKS